MANKRTLKKQIRLICGDVALECIFARECVPGIDRSKMNEVLVQVAELQQQALQASSFAFDHTSGQYNNKHDYHKAAHRYYAKAYKEFYNQFNSRLVEIVKHMNALLTEEARKINKEIAQSK